MKELGTKKQRWNWAILGVVIFIGLDIVAGYLDSTGGPGSVIGFLLVIGGIINATLMIYQAITNRKPI